MATKKQRTTEETYTQVIPVVSCDDEAQVNKIMQLCGIPRSLTYNKLGSLQGWDLDWKKADPIIRTIIEPKEIGLPAKMWEWSVSDTMKAIGAQQQAALVSLSREIWRKYPMQSIQKERLQWIEDNQEKKKSDELKALKTKALELFPPCSIEQARNYLFDLLRTDLTKDKWLHRKFRTQYQRGHTFVRNQIVYQGQGYTCKRVNRHSVELQIQGLERGKKIDLRCRCRHIIKGQIRVIRTQVGQLEIHCVTKRTLILPDGKPTQKIGIDKGYTEGFYTSEGIALAVGLGKLMTQKTRRVTKTNRNRYRIRAFALSLKPKDPQKAARILENNLGYKVKSRKLQRDSATIQNFIRRDLRRFIISPVDIICEDLTQPIKGNKQAKAINCKLNQWMKGELQASLEKISLETGSTISAVNPAYTSQVDSQTETLLGHRNGDHFIRYTVSSPAGGFPAVGDCETRRGDVIQADPNAAINIRVRGQDKQITRYMLASEVQAILVDRTVRYLHSIGHSVATALLQGWLIPKFKTIALKCESNYHPQGYVGTLKL